MSQTTSPLDPYRSLIEEGLAKGQSYAEIINQLPIPTSDRSIRRAVKRWGIERTPVSAEKPGMTIKDDEAQITGKASTEFNTPEDLMVERGLDPEDWEVVSLTVNEWDGTNGALMRQLKVHLRKKVQIALLAPARIDGPVYKAKPKKVKKGEPITFVLVGDQQAPYHNKHLHEVFCDFLDTVQPHRGILIGDTADFPDISRHPDNPEKDVSVQECIDSSYLILKDYREASVSTRWQKLAGNHDERIRRAQVDKLPRSYGVRRAQIPGEPPEHPVLDLEHLLRLDELGIDYIRPQGDYEHEQVNLSPYLAARHGWIARKGSGASALATVEHLGYSVIVGHTHRQSLVHKTRHDINGDLTVLAACETGCMCRIEDGLGYAVAPDWQNGFAVANVWPDGTFKIDLATYVDKVLYYQGERFT